VDGLVPGLADYAANAAAQKPNATVFEGGASLAAVKTDVLAAVSAGALICHVVGAPGGESAQLDAERSSLWTELERAGVKLRVLAHDSAIHGPQPRVTPSRLREVRYVPATRFPFKGEAIIFGGKAFALSPYSTTVAVLIEEPGVARMLLALFEVCWDASASHQLAASRRAQMEASNVRIPSKT